MRPHDCREFPAFTEGPPEFYARSLLRSAPFPASNDDDARPSPPKPAHRCVMFAAITPDQLPPSALEAAGGGEGAGSAQQRKPI